MTNEEMTYTLPRIPYLRLLVRQDGERRHGVRHRP
jgi:hypothetical protein